MSVVEFDYYALQSAIDTANKMGGSWGCYESYRSGIKSELRSSLDEWKLAGKEPKGHAYVSSAQSNIDSKRSALETRKNQWKGLATNLGNFKSYVESQDKAVANEFKTTSNAYTNYHGIGGAFTWLGDTFFNAFGVDIANSNKFTRTIADWGKRKTDDLNSWVKQNVVDYFKHGNGRYWANMAGSVALTLAAVAGTAIAIIGIPFTGGSSAVIAVGCIGAIAAGVGAGISAFNTVHTIGENSQALNMDDDPGMARFHGDVSSYSEHVSKHKYNSYEEYQKYAKLGKGIDITEGVCTVVSIGTGLATTFGTKTVSVVENGNKVSKPVFDFSGKNVKTNVLKTFGFKTNKEEIGKTIIRKEERLSINTANEVSDTTIDIFTSSNELTANSKTFEKTTEQIGKTKYTKRVATIDKISAGSEYTNIVASKGVATGSYTEYVAHADRVTDTIDYTNAVMSKDKVSKISYLEKLDKASSQKEIEQLKVKRILDNTQKGLNNISSTTKDITSNKDKTGTEIIKGIVKKNTFFGAVDKYIYTIPTSSDATAEDYLKGIGGSTGSKIYGLWDTITSDAA